MIETIKMIKEKKNRTKGATAQQVISEKKVQLFISARILIAPNDKTAKYKNGNPVIWNNVAKNLLAHLVPIS